MCLVLSGGSTGVHGVLWFHGEGPESWGDIFDLSRDRACAGKGSFTEDENWDGVFPHFKGKLCFFS